MENLPNVLKAVTDFFANSNVLLKLIDAFSKCKDKICSTVAFIVFLLAAIAYYYFSNDVSETMSLPFILLLCCFVLLIVQVWTSRSKNRVIEDLKKQFSDELTKVNEQHEHEITMQLEELKAELSVLTDQHKREKSELIFKHSRTQKKLIHHYHRLHRAFRNTINSIEKHHKADTKTWGDIVGQTENISVPVIHFTQDLLDCLAEIFTELTGETVCACVKTMVGKDFNQFNYSDAYVRTFLRSSNTSQDRVSYHDAHPNDVKLSENTDFMEVVAENRINISSCFYQGDIKQYKLDRERMNLEYNNTTLNYLSFYKGTIVAPIRIANQYIFYTDREEGYNTIGFLCVDSESTKAFPPECEKEYTSIMRSFAAMLYNVLSKYQFYLAEQERRIQKYTDNSDSVSSKKRKYTDWFLRK